jgi:ketosteroid isomerase-like protein
MGANAGVVAQAYDAFGRGDIAALLGLVDDEVDWHAPKTLPQGGTFHGKAGVGDFFATVAGAWDPLSLDVEGIGEVGDELVVGVVRGDGTRKGGGPSGYGAVHVFNVRGGKITRFREYTDVDAPLD